MFDALIEFPTVLRRVAQFFFWHHIKATLWISPVLVLVSIIYGFVVYPRLPSLTVYAFLNVALAVLGVAGFLAFILGLQLYVRRIDSR